MTAGLRDEEATVVANLPVLRVRDFGFEGFGAVVGVCCCFDLGDVRVPGLYSLVLVRLLVEVSGVICAAADLVSRPPFAGVTGEGGGGMVLIDLFLPVSSMKLEGVWAAADFHGGEGGPFNFRFLDGFRS